MHDKCVCSLQKQVACVGCNIHLYLVCGKSIYPNIKNIFVIINIFSGSAAQSGLWPPVALQPSAGYGFLWLCSPTWAMASSFSRFLDHTQ
jgi:hypothetical protein